MFQFGKKINKHIESLINKIQKNGEVLDLGSGLGANGVFLQKHGFNITCIDNNEEAINHLKKESPFINSIKSDILNFDFPSEKYDLILAINVLHFLRFLDVKNLVKKIFLSLKKNGIFYLQVFSTKDPGYLIFQEKAVQTEEKNTFFSNKTESYSHFFEKEEIGELFFERKILELEESVIHDNHPPLGEHEHGIIRVAVQK